MTSPTSCFKTMTFHHLHQPIIHLFNLLHFQDLFGEPQKKSSHEITDLTLRDLLHVVAKHTDIQQNLGENKTIQNTSPQPLPTTTSNTQEAQNCCCARVSSSDFPMHPGLPFRAPDLTSEVGEDELLGEVPTEWAPNTAPYIPSMGRLYIFIPTLYDMVDFHGVFSCR